MNAGNLIAIACIAVLAIGVYLEHREHRRTDERERLLLGGRRDRRRHRRSFWGMG